jgi:hypothetical protein
MARIGLERGRYGGLALSAAGALWLACAGQPAVAGDDGAAPIWSSLGSVFGGFFDNDKVEPDIQYRDRPRLVLPPKLDLPPPAASPSASATDWPRDPDVENFKKMKAEQDKPHTRTTPARLRTGGEDAQIPVNGVVTTNYTSGLGPSQRKCMAGPGGSCDSAPSPSINWNPLTWVGLEKKPATVLGPEPARTSLTDPPLGYREPVEGVGAKVDSN